MKGKLVVTKKRDGVSFRVEYTSEKGKPSSAAVSATAKCFRDADAVDGLEVEIELKNGQPSRVTIPGKPQIEGQAVQRAGADLRNGAGARHGGRNPHAAPRGPANTDARAPYNFISAQTPVGFDPAPDTTRFSGTIYCTLKALTPLLVSGPQIKSPEGVTERRFFEVAGAPTIPGTSLKGVIRSVVEVLSCAPLNEGLSDRKVAYRDVNSADMDSPYGRRFRGSDEELCAGMLSQSGAERRIVPCSWMRLDGEELGIPRCRELDAVRKYQALEASGSIRALQPISFEDSGCFTDSGDPIARRAPDGPQRTRGVPVFTGALPTKWRDYVFFGRRREDELTVPREVWDDFINQLTTKQEELLAYFREKLKAPSVPVFFLRRRDGGTVTAMGLSRYFRVVAPYQPRDLAPPLARGTSLPERMFGRVGQGVGESMRGRVCFHAATPSPRGGPQVPTATQFPREGNLVAGNPSATAVSLYLEQDSGTVRLVQGRNYVNEGLSTFASGSPVLRGRKLYWHRQQPSAAPPPNANLNVQARYFPLPAGTSFEFSITVDRLDAVELGALVEALELPDGAAHKLGLGKAFGLGSIRVDFDLTRTVVQADCIRYSGLRQRCGRSIDCSRLFAESREKFRQAVAAHRGGHSFESLVHVREFRVMTDFQKPRDPHSISYMELNAGNDTPSYRMKPILRRPLEIPPAT